MVISSEKPSLTMVGREVDFIKNEYVKAKCSIYAYSGTLFSIKKERRPGKMEQDPVALAPWGPLLASCGKLSGLSLTREMRSAETKENSRRRPNNKVVIKHSQGPAVPPQGLQIIF